MDSEENEQSLDVPSPQIGLNNVFKDQPCSKMTLWHPSKSDAVETSCGVITPENLIWDPPNLKELGPLKFIGIYNLPPAFWPASLRDTVKNHGIDVDVTSRANNIKNPSSPVLHDTFEELLENLDLPALCDHETKDLFEILGISVDACNEQNETSAIIGQEEHKEKLPLSPDVTYHNMKAAATDSEELLSYVTGSRKRKREISSENEFCSLLDDFEICEPPHALPRLDYTEHVEDFITTLCCSVFSDESIDF